MSVPPLHLGGEIHQTLKRGLKMLQTLTYPFFLSLSFSHDSHKLNKFQFTKVLLVLSIKL